MEQKIAWQCNVQWHMELSEKKTLAEKIMSENHKQRHLKVETTKFTPVGNAIKQRQQLEEIGVKL